MPCEHEHIIFVAPLQGEIYVGSFVGIPASRSDLWNGFVISASGLAMMDLSFRAVAGGLRVDGRQTAPYSPELEPDIVLTQPHASGVDETCTPLVIAEGGSIPLHWMAELIAFKHLGELWGKSSRMFRRMPTARYRHAADERKREF
jgi:hypothetical protein